jgi:uncharacterized protein YihD (DUF1040 family)
MDNIQICKLIKDGKLPLSYRKILKRNIKNKLINTAQINGRKSAIVLKDAPLKPLTDEVISDFLKMKESGKYKWQIRKSLEEKYKLGEKNIIN